MTMGTMKISVATLAVVALMPVACLPAWAAKPPKAAKTKSPPLTTEQRAAQSILKSLSLHDRVAQLVIGVALGDVPSRKSPEYEKFHHWVHDLHIGGMIVNNPVRNGIVQNAEPHAMALFLNQMQKLAKTPLIVAADFERGASMRVTAGARFPYNMAIGAAGDIDAARFEGEVTAREARAVGVHWIFAPVADVNNNPDNPVINVRSFGENPDEVAKYVAAYIEGSHSDSKNRVLVTAKHFPGHGDTNVDSHLGLPRISVSKERMEAVELKPFEAAISHGVDAIMTAHLSVPAIEPDDIPSTASPKVITGLLRDELGFKGIVVTDALDMAGFASQFNSGEGSVRALEAGADVLLMPPNPEQAIRAVIAAVENGRLTRQRIDASVMRVLTAKVHIGIVKKKLADLDEISDVLDDTEVAGRVQKMSDRAVTLVRNQSNLVPLAPQSKACLVVTVGARLSTYGQRMVTEFHRRVPSGHAIIVDPSMPLAALIAEAGDPGACSAIAIAIFSTGTNPYADVPAFLDQLTAGRTPVVVIAMGSPYVVAGVPKAAAFLATFSPTVPSEVSAIKALFGEIAITGRLPVTVPGFAKYGEGIQVEAQQPGHSPEKPR
jgi:beta-N-acetylhexosaminidase